jgi:hypothetical protein
MRDNIKKPHNKKQSSKFFDKYTTKFPKNYLFSINDPKSLRMVKRDIVNLLIKDIAKGTVNLKDTAVYFTQQFVSMIYFAVLDEYNSRIRDSEVFKYYIAHNGDADRFVVEKCDELIRSRAVYDIIYRDIALFYQTSEYGTPDFNILQNMPNKIKYSDAYLI